MWARFFANKVYETNSTPVASSTVTNGDLPAVVPPTLFAQRDSELSDGSAFPEMDVQRTAKVSDTGGDGLVGFEKSRSPGEGLRDGCGSVE
jgi:hypothetical protein